MTTQRRLTALLTLLAAATLIAGPGTWNGSINNNWGEPANWDGALPNDPADTATIPAGPYSIDNDLPALALLRLTLSGTLGDPGHTLTGNPITLGPDGITATAGPHTIAAPITGPHGLTQSGGHLILTAPNTHTGPTTLTTGILQITTPAALGDSAPDPANLTLGEGVFRYTGPSATLNRGYTIAPTNSGTSRATIFDIPDRATTLTITGQAAAPAGAFIKLGEGTLALTHPGEQQLSRDKTSGNDGLDLIIDQNGSAGTNGYVVFSVEQGTLILGAPGQTNRIAGTSWVGGRTLASPRLDITSGVTIARDGNFTIGRGTGTLTNPQRPSINLTGGATLQIGNFIMGYSNGRGDYYSEPTLNIDNASTVTVAGAYCFIGENASLTATVNVANGSLFQSDTTEPNRSLALPQTPGANATLNATGGSTVRAHHLLVGRGGTLNVTGSTLEFNGTALNATLENLNRGTARFDNATLRQRAPALASDWFTGLSDLLIGTGGLTVDVTSHAWLDAVHKPSPDGTLTKTGPGTLTLRPTPGTINVTAGHAALTLDHPYLPATAAGHINLDPGTTLALGGARGAGGMALNLNGAPLTLTPPSLATQPQAWALVESATRYGDGRIRLTPDSGGARGAAWLNTRQNIAGPWTATFTYICYATRSNGDPADGITLAIHNDPRDTAAIGVGGGSLGYAHSNGTGGITDSIAVCLDPNTHQLRFGTNGTFTDTHNLRPDIPKLALTPVKTRVTVTYNGADTLTATIAHPGHLPFRADWPVNIPAHTGADHAWLGFTGGTGGRYGQHTVADITFSNGTDTAPAAPAVTRTGGRVTLGPADTLTATTDPNAPAHGYLLNQLTYAHGATIDTTTAPAAPLTLIPPTLDDPAQWRLNGHANWKEAGHLATSAPGTDQRGTAHTTTAYPLTGSWTATFDYDIGTTSTPRPADFLVFILNPGGADSTANTPNPGLSIMWRYYENPIFTTQLKMYTNNIGVTASQDITPINLATRRTATMTVTHDAPAKTITVTTTQASDTHTHTFENVDMFKALNSHTARIGFGGDVGGSYAENIVSNLRFTWTDADPAPAAPGSIGFETLTGTGTLTKRGTAALLLPGDIDRPTSNATVRLEAGGLTLRKANLEPLDLIRARSEWIFSPLGKWAPDGSLQVCPAINNSNGTGTSIRRVRATDAWTARFSFYVTGASPADAITMFLHDDPRGPGISQGNTREAAFSGMANSFGISWNLYPGSSDTDKDSVRIGRNGSLDTATIQHFAPLHVHGATTDFTVSHDPDNLRITSIMTQGDTSVTNIFENVNLSTAIPSGYAYFGFGGGTGGASGDMRVTRLHFDTDTPADTQPDEIYLAHLILPEATANTVTLDTPVPSGTYRITAATLAGGATLGLAAARQPGTLILGTATHTGPAAYDITPGNTLAIAALTGTGGLTKRGDGTLVLTGTATHAGDTRLEAGTLILTDPNLPRATDLHITPGAILNLPFTGRQYIHALTLDGTPQPGGAYTSANSPSWITGDGILIVTPPPTGTLLLLK